MAKLQKSYRDTVAAIELAAQSGDSSGLIAMGVIMENREALEKDIEADPDFTLKWAYAAGKIKAAIAVSDEPEFSLYDYLSAIAVSDIRGEVISEIWSSEDVTSELFDKLIDAARMNRKTYDAF